MISLMLFRYINSFYKNNRIISKTNTLKKVIFLGSINSEFVCDQPLSYMVAKASCDTAVKFYLRNIKCDFYKLHYWISKCEI